MEETSPSNIGVTVIEKMTSKLVFTILILLLAYSIFYDLPQLALRDSLYQQQLNSLLLIHRRTETTESEAFLAALDAVIGNGTDTSLAYFRQVYYEHSDFANQPFVVFVKIAGITVFFLVSGSLSARRARPMSTPWAEAPLPATATCRPAYLAAMWGSVKSGIS